MAYIGKRPQDTFPATNAITSTLIAENNITAREIATNSIVTSLIADNAITAVKIAENVISSRELAANTILTGNIADNAVDGTKIAQNSILTRHIDDAQITTSHIIDANVTTAKIADVNVTTAKIADDAVTVDKMAGLARGKIIYGDASGNPAALDLGTSGQVLKSDGTDIAWGTDEGLSTEQVQDIAGGMFTGNTETGITATYQDADGTIDLVVGTLNQDSTGNAATATTLETARTIGGVSFDGSANISLPGVDAVGNQNTTGSAATLTTARTIGGVSFDGSANINLPGVNAAGSQDTSGTAALATSITASANNSTDETVYLTFIDGATGTQGVETDTGLTYNPSTGVLTTTSVTGNLTGNVTGNASGTAATVTGGTQAAITSAANLVTVGTIGTGVWQGTPIASAYIAGDAITGAKIADDAIDSEHFTDGSIDTAHIADDQVTAAKLADTAVTAASYGSSSAIPVITVDAQGRITAASTAATSSVLTIAADSGSNDTLTVGTDTLTFEGTANEIETTVSNNKINVALPDNVVIGGNLTVTGDYTVNGSTSTNSVTNMVISDNLIELNNGAGSNANDSGLVIERGSTGDNAIFMWDESADKFVVGTTTATGASTGNLTVTTGTLVANLEGNVTGNVSGTAATVTTAAQPNITSLGTLTTLTVDDITIDGSTISDSGNFTIDSGADISLDSSNGSIRLKDDGTEFGKISQNSNNLRLYSSISDGDILLQGNDDGSTVTALTLDMSDAGTAIFNHDITLPDNGIAKFGAGSDLQIYHDGSNSYITDSGTGNLKIGGANVEITTAGGTKYFQGASNIATLYHTGNEKLATTSTGIEVTGNIANASGDLTLDVGGDIILDADGGDVKIKDGGTVFGGFTNFLGNLVIRSGASDNVIIFGDSDGDMIMGGNVALGDNKKIIFGNGVGGNLQLFHDGTDSFLDDVAEGNLILRTNGDSVKMMTGSENMVVATKDGAVDLYYDNSKKLETTSAGVTVTGEVAATSLDISGDVDIDGTLEADAITVNGTTLSETIADTVGAMVTSNTESGITVAYQDADNTLDFTVGTLNQNTTGSAATWTTARTLSFTGDVTGSGSVDGSANVATALTIADDAVGADQLAVNSVVSASIVNGSIVGADIAANTITVANIADNAVDATKIASNSILTRHIDDNQITGDQIADDIVLSGTGALRMPDGTTAQRPGTPAAGMFRYNTTEGKFEGYTDSWGEVGGGGSSGFLTDIFTGSTTPATDGSRVEFTMSQAVSSENFVMVFVDGVYQAHSSYSVSGSTLTMADAPVAGRTLTVHSVSAAVQGDGLNVDNFSGDGSDVTFTLSLNPTHENNTQVYVDGVYQFKNTYSVSGTTLTFSSAPPNGSAIEVMTHSQTTVNNAASLNATAISALSEVSIAGADHLMFFDATDNTLKKGLASDLVEQLTTEEVQDVIGAMVSSNTESGITVAYDDSDGTLDFTVGTLNQNTTGSAATVTTAAQPNITSLGTLTGLTTTGDINLGDSNKAIFGAGSDLQIYHDGSQSIIEDVGTGQLKILAENTLHLGSATGTETYIRALKNGTVELYYDDAVKLATTSTGIDVTGVVTASTSAKITQVALTSSSAAVAWDASGAANAYHVTTENTTFSAPSNAVEGAIIQVEIAQGGTARTIAWNTVFEFAASTAPTVTATANKTDIFTFRYNGSVWQEIGRVQNLAQT